MANAFATLKKAAFDGIEFATESVRVRGGLRYHVHEYPHVPGGDAEKLGRRVYEVEMVANFQATFASYPGLWPGRLASLRALFEAGATRKLIIPTIGVIDAFCSEWDQEQTNKVLSGEHANFKFVEDQDLSFLVDKLVSVKVDSLDAKAKVYQVQAQKFGIDQDLTDQLVNAVNGVLAIADTADAYGALLAAKIGMVAALCREFDQRIQNFQDPLTWPAVEAMKDLWAAADELARNVKGDENPFAIYEVKRQSTITQVAVAIYGDTARAMELLQLNPIEDAFDIRPGTRVKYLVERTSLRAA